MAIDLIDTIKPKNNGTFPMVEAEDVVVGKGTAEEMRLPAALKKAGPVVGIDTDGWDNPADNRVPSTALVKAALAKVAKVYRNSQTLVTIGTNDVDGTYGSPLLQLQEMSDDQLVRVVINSKEGLPTVEYYLVKKEALEGKLTEEAADARYLKLTGGTVNGAVSFNAGISTRGLSMTGDLHIENYRIFAGRINIGYDPNEGTNCIRRKDIRNLVLPGDGLAAAISTDDKVTLVVKPATASSLGGVKVGSGLTVDENGTLSATGSGVTIDTTLPDEPTDDHVPSTKLVKDYLLNGKGQINYIYCGNGGFSFMGGESSAFPGAQFDIAPPPPTGEEKFFRMGDASSAAGLIPVPTKDYVDEAVAAKQDKLVAGDGLTQTTEASGIRLDLKPATATSLGGVKVAGGNTGVGIDADTGTLRVVGQSDGQGGVWFGNDLFMSYAGGNLQVVIPSGTFELTSKAYVDGLVGDISAALAAI